MLYYLCGGELESLIFNNLTPYSVLPVVAPSAQILILNQKILMYHIYTILYLTSLSIMNTITTSQALLLLMMLHIKETMSST